MQDVSFCQKETTATEIVFDISAEIRYIATLNLATNPKRFNDFQGVSSTWWNTRIWHSFFIHYSGHFFLILWEFFETDTKVTQIWIKIDMAESTQILDMPHTARLSHLQFVRLIDAAGPPV